MQKTIQDMVGLVFTSVVASDDTLTFTTAKGEKFELYHSQGCCESVTIDDITGDLECLVGEPLLVAEESVSDTASEDTTKEESWSYDSETWTFYKFATIRGWVDVRWYGSSNGYYSESVDLKYIEGTQ